MAIDKIQANAFADDAITADKINLANNFAFTGTVTGTPSDMTKIATTTVGSAVSSIDFETFSTDYKFFCWHLFNISPSTNTASLNLRFKTSGSSSYRADSNSYKSARDRVYQNGGTSWTDSAGGYQGDAGTVYMGINSAGNGFAEAGKYAIVYVNDVHSTNQRKSWSSHAWGGTDNQNNHIHLSSTTYEGSGSMEAVTGVRFMMHTGNIASGSITMYGLKA